MPIADKAIFCRVWLTRGYFSAVSVLEAFEAQLAFITMRWDETRRDASLDQLKKRAGLKSASSILCRPHTICSLMTDALTICHRQNTIG